jgi:hypothetical protein
MNSSDVQPLQSPESALPHVEAPPTFDRVMYDRGVAAFERELPELMKTHHRQFVFYHGERRIGPFKTLRKLNAECRKQRIPLIEGVCRVIEPDLSFEVAS